MRTFEEIRTDINDAISITDAAALQVLAAEMQTLDTPKARATAMGTLAIVYLRTGDYPSALDHFRRALALWEELDDRAQLAGVTANIGIVYNRTGEYAGALEHFYRSLALHEELGDRSNVARCMTNIGIVHSGTGDNPAALEHYHRAHGLFEELNDRTSAARVTNSIGKVYIQTGDYKAALKYHHRALAMSEELGDRSAVATATSSIAAAHLGIGEYQSALEHSRRARALYGEVGQRSDVARETCNIVTALMMLDQYDEAAEQLEEQASMMMNEPGTRAWHNAHRATLANREGDFDAAHVYLTDALALSTEAGMRSESADFHKELRDLAQKRNDFAGFIEHNAEFLRITEEIHGKESTQRIAVMEAERAMEAERRERDKERALLYSALPRTIADRMIRGEDVTGDHFDHATVLFLDIAGFTSNTSHMSPASVVKMLENIFSTIDGICDQHSVIKIKTIGDSYMCFAHGGNGELGMGNGIEQRTASPEQQVAAAALAIQQSEFYWPREASPEGSHEDSLDRLAFRIGIHRGPVTAGVIGTQRLQYDVWGDTVNVASRMESSGEPGRIHVSEAFANALNTSPQFPIPYSLRERGALEIKGKGTMTTYWLEQL